MRSLGARGGRKEVAAVGAACEHERLVEGLTEEVRRAVTEGVEIEAGWVRGVSWHWDEEGDGIRVSGSHARSRVTGSCDRRRLRSCGTVRQS